MAKVAIIGAGPLGLMALKNFREAGLDATAFEARSWVGGIWNYSEDESTSVGEFTVFNSSKFRSAISDWPFPDDADDFPTWQQVQNWLQSYADYFNLMPHICLSCPVSSLDRKDGKWVVKVAPANGSTRVEMFDKVVVATGSFVSPRQPTFKGIEKFKGTQVHSMYHHHGRSYKDQNVMIVGLHSTAQDVSISLQGHAKHVYVSHRSGVNLLPRYDPKGTVLDAGMNLNFFLFQLFADTYFPRAFMWLINKAMASMQKQAFGVLPDSWQFSPPPSAEVAPPMIGDEIYAMMKSGFCEPVDAVTEVLGPKSFRLRNGVVLDDVDAIIYCTGYDPATPFIPEEWNPYARVGDVSNLYRNIFSLHPDPEVRNSLAFLGHGATVFPGFVQFEVMGMAVANVFRGLAPLPPYEEQLQWRRRYLAWRADTLRRNPTHKEFMPFFLPVAEHVSWLDDAGGTDILKHFGWLSTKAWSFWWRDPKLYKLCKSGLFSPAIWRLFESDRRKAWPGAREQILKDNERLAKSVQAKQRKRRAAAEKEKSQ